MLEEVWRYYLYPQIYVWGGGGGEGVFFFFFFLFLHCGGGGGGGLNVFYFSFLILFHIIMKQLMNNYRVLKDKGVYILVKSLRLWLCVFLFI